MSVIMIALNTVNPDNPDAVKAYAEAAMPLIKAAGGKPIGRFDCGEVITGTGFPGLVLAVEFPSAQAIKQVFESDAYKALIPMRDKAFSSFNVCISNAD